MRRRTRKRGRRGREAGDREVHAMEKVERKDVQMRKKQEDEERRESKEIQVKEQSRVEMR